MLFEIADWTDVQSLGASTFGSVNLRLLIATSIQSFEVVGTSSLSMANVSLTINGNIFFKVSRDAAATHYL